MRSSTRTSRYDVGDEDRTRRATMRRGRARGRLPSPATPRPPFLGSGGVGRGGTGSQLDGCRLRRGDGRRVSSRLLAEEELGLGLLADVEPRHLRGRRQQGPQAVGSGAVNRRLLVVVELVA